MVEIKVEMEIEDKVEELENVGLLIIQYQVLMMVMISQMCLVTLLVCSAYHVVLCLTNHTSWAR